MFPGRCLSHSDQAPHKGQPLNEQGPCLFVQFENMNISHPSSKGVLESQQNMASSFCMAIRTDAFSVFVPGVQDAAADESAVVALLIPADLCVLACLDIRFTTGPSSGSSGPGGTSQRMGQNCKGHRPEPPGTISQSNNSF